MAFGDMVRALRLAQHLTQDDLAAMMGLSRAMIAFWEGGQRRPNPGQLPKLAACLGYWQIDGDGRLRREIVELALAALLKDAT